MPIPTKESIVDTAKGIANFGSGLLSQEAPEMSTDNVNPPGGVPIGNPKPTDEIRSSLPEVDTTIDPSQFSSGGAVQGQIANLEPPEDINAAQIGEYTPYDAVMGEVDPEATVEGRLSGLLSQKSDYMDRARQSGYKTANRAGLLNTSMAAGAAHGAAIDRALPIAQQDAAAFLEQQFRNQGYSNEAAKYLAEQSVQRENLQAGFDQDTAQFNAAQQFEAEKINNQNAQRVYDTYAGEQNRNNFAVLNADLTTQIRSIDNELALNLEQMTREYSILENLDSVNGQIYQQMIADMGTILANTEDPGEARAKMNMLIDAAGVEFEFSTGETMGGGGGGPQKLAAPPKPEKKKTTRSFGGGGEGGASDGPGGDAGNASSGSGGGGGGGGGSGGCFSGDTCFYMADGSLKEIKDLEIGDVTLGGVVTNTRSGPSGRMWFDYLGSKVTDEHFVFEGGKWMYVKDSVFAVMIDQIDTFYTVDTTDHALHGINGALFSDDAVFDEDHFTHDLPYGKKQWDLQLEILNREPLEEAS